MSADRRNVKYWMCPWCFARGNDSAPLHYYKKENKLYCVRCCYSGDAKQTLEAYNDYQKKYRLMEKRLNIL